MSGTRGLPWLSGGGAGRRCHVSAQLGEQNSSRWPRASTAELSATSGVRGMPQIGSGVPGATSSAKPRRTTRSGASRPRTAIWS